MVPLLLLLYHCQTASVQLAALGSTEERPIQFALIQIDLIEG